MWLIKNVWVVDPSQGLSGERDVLIKGKQIEGIYSQGNEINNLIENGQEVNIVDGKGKFLFPGLIDVHTHLREPGQEYKEDIASGVRAAVRGGFTSIMIMANTIPVIDNKALVEFVINQADRQGLAKVYPIGCVTKGMAGEELVEMMDLIKSGVVAFSDDGRVIQNAERMRLALEYAKLTEVPIISHCEDIYLAKEGVMHRGDTSIRLGLKGIPSSAESTMVARDILLAEETGGKLHLAHISAKESVELIRAAKKRGVDVTAEVNPHHLIFCDEDITITNTFLKVNPPIRTVADRDALLEGLIDGTIDMIATDHAPHAWEEKTRPFAEAPFGINALETSLSAMWLYLVSTGVLSVERLIETWSSVPAQRFNLSGGTLKPGSVADVVLFDPDFKEVIKEENLVSKSSNTPFLEQELNGFPIMTWINGELVQKDRIVLK